MATGYLESEDRRAKVFSQQSSSQQITLHTHRNKTKNKVIKPPHNLSHLTTTIHTVRATQWPPLAEEIKTEPTKEKNKQI